MAKKGLSAFNEEGAVTVGGNRVEAEQLAQEINEAPEKEAVEEYDHRSDEDKNAEGFKEIIKEWKEEFPDEDKQVESEDDANAVDEEPDSNSPESKEDAQTETEPKKEKADDELSVIPEVLRRSALELGVTPDEIQEMKSIEDLTKVLDAIKSIQPKAEEEVKIEPEEDPLDKIVLDPDEYEESLITAFDGLKDMVRTLREDNNNLKDKDVARDKEVSEQAEFRMQAEKIKSFDDAVGKLENKELFGEGNISTIDYKSEAFKNRSNLFDEVDIIGNSYYKAKKDVPSTEELVEMAGKRLFGDKFNKEEKTSKQLEERSQALLGRPSPREAVEAEPEGDSKEANKSKAVSAVGKLLKEYGLKK